jgi:hypothetical protein
MKSALTKASAFCERFGLKLPILLAPMAGASAPSLSIAVANAGGLGACGALLMQPAAILSWAAEVRAGTNGAFQLNLWVPDPKPFRDPEHEARVRGFLAGWGPLVPPEAGDATPPDFAAQCEAFLQAAPPIVSSVMGLYPPDLVARLKAKHIAWFANISTVAEARAAEAAGADVVVAQGMEAGGHRGCFHAAKAEAEMVGSFALIPAVVDAVRIPVVATGGIADARGVAAALTFGGISCTDRHRLSPLPRGADRPGLGRCDWPHSARGDYGEPRVQWPGGSKYCDRLCPRGDRTRGAETGAVSGPTRSDNRYARCGHQGRRYRKDSGLGGAVSRLGKGGASWGRRSIALGGRPRPPRLISGLQRAAWRMGGRCQPRGRRTRSLSAVTLEDGLG